MSISLLQPLRDVPLAFVDVETTGASVDFGHRVIEMGIARVEGGRVVAEYERLLDPGRRISAGVTALTGISQQMVEGQPTFADEAARMLELMSGCVVVGHNVRFDLSFLRKEFRRSGRDLVECVGDHPVMDTVRIARRRFGRGGNGLQILSRRLGYVPDVAHRALADVRTTVAVFDRLMEPIGGWSLPLCDALLAQGGRMGLLPANPRESLLPLELEEALDLRKPVIMEYLDARDARTLRTIEPRTIRRMNGELILIAHCHLRQAQRTFKVERIVRLTRVGEETAAVTPSPQQTMPAPVQLALDELFTAVMPAASEGSETEVGGDAEGAGEITPPVLETRPAAEPAPRSENGAATERAIPPATVDMRESESPAA